MKCLQAEKVKGACKRYLTLKALSELGPPVVPVTLSEVLNMLLILTHINDV